MNIVFVLHELSLTGAPKIGLQIATILARMHKVWLIAKSDGPLRAQIPSVFEDVTITDTHHSICQDSLEKRIGSAMARLDGIRPDLVYVNSLAAGDWLSAAVRGRYRNLLHVHEMSGGIVSLARAGTYHTYDVQRADRILAASRECMRDIRDIFGVSQPKVSNFGVCVDIDDILEKSRLQPVAGCRHDGVAVALCKQRGAKRIIATCGLAQQRKGADIFWETARLIPEHDFLWIGPWNEGEALGANPALALNEREPLSNLYWTNTTDNPYAVIARADMFVLTAREDPNPLVVPEAISLGLPVLTFAVGGGAHHWTSRWGISLSGSPNPQRLSSFIRRFFSQGESDWHPSLDFIQEANIKARVVALCSELEAGVAYP
jgi:glycosyltransferase involved in cell wall biosynthesis